MLQRDNKKGVAHKSGNNSRYYCKLRHKATKLNNQEKDLFQIKYWHFYKLVQITCQSNVQVKEFSKVDSYFITI